jgi:hypothetical protein
MGPNGARRPSLSLSGHPWGAPAPQLEALLPRGHVRPRRVERRPNVDHQRPKHPVPDFVPPLLRVRRAAPPPRAAPGVPLSATVPPVEGPARLVRGPEHLRRRAVRAVAGRVGTVGVGDRPAAGEPEAGAGVEGLGPVDHDGVRLVAARWRGCARA